MVYKYVQKPSYNSTKVVSVFNICLKIQILEIQNMQKTNKRPKNYTITKLISL